MDSPLLCAYFRKLRMVYCSELQLISFFSEVPGGRELVPRLVDLSRGRRDLVEVLAAQHGISSAGDDCQSMRRLIAMSRGSLEGSQNSYAQNELVIDVCESIHRLLLLNYGLARSLATKCDLRHDVEQLDSVLDNLIEEFPAVCEYPVASEIVDRAGLQSH